MSLRDATFPDAEVLTDIAFKSKAVWGYPEAYFNIWRSELTITPDYIRRNLVRVFQSGDVPVAFYSLVRLTAPLTVADIALPAGLWLDHMFILPGFIGQGIGSRMFADAARHGEMLEADQLKILADPNARGFYEKLGCAHRSDFPSTIPGRTTPYLEYRLTTSL